MLAIGFLTPLTSLVGMGSSLLVIRSYIERLDDVFEALPEQAGAVVKQAPVLRGALRAEGVSFQYSRSAPFVVEDVSVDLRPGKMLAIVGPSGSGKTTLAHVLVGLYVPVAGEVYLDDEPLSALMCTACAANSAWSPRTRISSRQRCGRTSCSGGRTRRSRT